MSLRYCEFRIPKMVVCFVVNTILRCTCINQKVDIKDILLILIWWWNQRRSATSTEKRIFDMRLLTFQLHVCNNSYMHEYAFTNVRMNLSFFPEYQPLCFTVKSWYSNQTIFFTYISAFINALQPTVDVRTSSYRLICTY